MKDLTKAEEQVMRILWKLEKAFLKDVVEAFPEPKPAYTTVSTVMRVLVSKKFIGFKSYGKVHEYFPLVSKKVYFGEHINGVIRKFFDGSANQFASFFADNQNLDLKELENIRNMIDEKIDQLKKDND